MRSTVTIGQTCPVFVKLVNRTVFTEGVMLLYLITRHIVPLCFVLRLHHHAVFLSMVEVIIVATWHPVRESAVL